jgi:Flp pilus assembly CpaE family ATPase
MSQRVFVVVGAKGGVGATTLAIKLIQRFPTGSERVIVDADLAGKRSLAVWYALNADLDLVRIIGTPAVAEVKGGPVVMEFARTYEDGLIHTADSTLKSIEAISKRAVVVVDAPQPFAAAVRPLIARAAKIIVMSEPTLLGVAAARAMLSAMDRAGMLTPRILFVLSNVRGARNVTRTDIERELSTPVSADLPHERDETFDAVLAGLVNILEAERV